MINKRVASVQEALDGIHDGATIMIGGFGGSGTPQNLISGLVERGVKDLTIICNSFNNIIGLPDDSQVRKVIMSFPIAPWRGTTSNPLENGILSGRIAVEMVPQGTLAERIRAGGSGLAAFYTPTGAGTLIAADKEQREFDGRLHVLERALKADFALIKAHKGDIKGNLSYRMAMKNFNPMMAMAGRTTIAEVGEVVDGCLEAEAVDTPGVFVDRVVQAAPVVLAFRLPRKDGKQT